MSLPPYYRAEVIAGRIEVQFVDGTTESVPLQLALAASDLLAACASAYRIVRMCPSACDVLTGREVEGLIRDAIRKAVGGAP